MFRFRVRRLAHVKVDVPWPSPSRCGGGSIAIPPPERRGPSIYDSRTSDLTVDRPNEGTAGFPWRFVNHCARKVTIDWLLIRMVFVQPHPARLHTTRTQLDPDPLFCPAQHREPVDDARLV